MGENFKGGGEQVEGSEGEENKDRRIRICRRFGFGVVGKTMGAVRQRSGVETQSQVRGEMTSAAGCHKGNSKRRGCGGKPATLEARRRSCRVRVGERPSGRTKSALIEMSRTKPMGVRKWVEGEKGRNSRRKRYSLTTMLGHATSTTSFHVPPTGLSASGCGAEETEPAQDGDAGEHRGALAKHELDVAQ
ncbi:hypothetical protein DFP72DRAFT_840633 [Ephemerocybe angulata]|uniref:Uncharacterized protein n=1 Tax=Ephemerocybe angulata TaxID=980116 RepID=A0A8H6MFT6_9AGAR|nr:hypothetical protein DFP72DRAFT_840633 [Tulosesus angulatus]